MSIKLWLHEPVIFGQSHVKRGALLKSFLNDGLVPFMNDMGYVIGTPVPRLYNDIVTGLYENQKKSALESVWSTDYYCRDWTVEDRAHYYHTVAPDLWEKFWNNWKWIEDFSEFSYRGPDRRMDVEEYVWRQLDLDNSYQSEVLYGTEEDADEQEIEDNSKKVDVYLVEASGWGGMRR